MQFLAGNYPVDLVLLGLLAAFLVLRLRSILGKRTGLERSVMSTPALRAQGPVVETRAEPVVPATERTVPDTNGPAGLALSRIRELDRGFDPQGFLTQAETAFRRIVAAYAAGDRATLRDALTAEAYLPFEAAIVAREAAGETQRAEIRAITRMQIVQASVVPDGAANRAAIEVRFVSDQVSLLLGRDGQPVSGADAVTELADSWTFERILSASGGNRDGWRLAAAHSA